jgi:TonB family protein
VHCNARVFGLLVMAGCTVGAPPGFSGGDRWTFPLVGPLEGGLLITPATVKGKGPYLFAFDPDANFSAVDKRVVDEAGLQTSAGPKIIDETDTGQIRKYAELVDLQVATLAIARRNVLLFDVGYFDSQGRNINGILGRDVIADSLVFGFDRDQGIATLSTTQAFTAPPDAIAIAYTDLSGESTGVGGASSGGTVVARGAGGRGSVVEPGGNTAPGRVGGGGGNVAGGAVLPVPRRLVNAQVGGAQLAMHLDLGSAVSQLPESRWTQAGSADLKLRLVDEAASVRHVTRGWTSDVALGAAKAQDVAFVPYVEARFGKDRVDGALGLDFFAGYAVYAHWDKRTFYLKPRGDAAATSTARLGRWGAALPACPHPGCATATIAAGPTGPSLEMTRDPEAVDRGLELVLAVAPAGPAAPAGKLVPLIVELPRGVLKLSNPLPAEYAGATVAVIDVSPFPRACVGADGCVLPLDDTLTRGKVVHEAPAAAPPSAPPDAAPTAPAPAPAGPARNVTLDKLRRVSGDAAIPPGDDAKKAAGGKPIAAAIVKVCLAADGKVESTKIVKSSGVAAYDDQLQATIKASWAFAPQDKPELLCTTATFTTR